MAGAPTPVPAWLGETARPIESVDIMPIIAHYSPEERRVLFHNISSIESTYGCSGGCYDCYLEVPTGPTHEISVESYERMLQEYGIEIDDRVQMYHGSEFFDHDRCVELYRLLKRYKPECASRQMISTYFPKGKEEAFAQLAAEMIQDTTPGKNSGIRISLRGRSNSQRLSELMRYKERLVPIKARALEILGAQFATQTEAFFDPEKYGVLSGVVFSNVDTKRQPLGRASPGFGPEGLDPVSGLGSVACVDGVVLSPVGFRGITMTAHSPFNTKGEDSFPIEPGDHFKVPTWRYRMTAFHYFSAIQHDIYASPETDAVQPIFLSPIQVTVFRGGMRSVMEQPSLPRELLAFRQFLEEMAVWKGSTLEERNYQGRVKNTIHRAIIEYQERRQRTQILIDQQLYTPEHIYFTQAGRAYLAIMDFVFEYLGQRIDDPAFRSSTIFDVIHWASALETANLDKPLADQLEQFLTIQSRIARVEPIVY